MRFDRGTTPLIRYYGRAVVAAHPETISHGSAIFQSILSRSTMSSAHLVRRGFIANPQRKVVRRVASGGHIVVGTSPTRKPFPSGITVDTSLLEALAATATRRFGVASIECIAG